MSEAAPNVHRRRLGAQLRTLRKQADLSQEEAARRLGVSTPALSRMENGKQRVPRISIPGFVQTYGIKDESVAESLRSQAVLASAGRRTTSLLNRFRDAVPIPFAEYLELEESAKRSEKFASTVPGILQTEEYAHAVVSSNKNLTSQKEIQQFVELRMERQKILTRAKPLGLWVILDESAVRREVGGSSVIRRQLQRLVEVAESMPHVQMQLLPFSHGANAGMDGPFTLLHFDAGAPVAVAELLTTSLYMEEENDVERYQAAFNHLRTEALTTDQSLARLVTMMKDHTA